MVIAEIVEDAAAVTFASLRSSILPILLGAMKRSP